MFAYPTILFLHTVGLAFLVGPSIAIGARVLGFARQLSRKSMIGLLPFVWVGFIINATTGSLLFIYGATGFGTNKAFYLKMTFMVIAGLNALAFDLAVRRATLDWVSADRPPPYVKVFATLAHHVGTAIENARLFQQSDLISEFVHELRTPLTSVQGYLEASNTSVVDELVSLIVGQRAYEANSRSVQTSDEMLQTAVNLKR